VPSRSWEALVAEGIRLGRTDPLDRWALGDLCIEAIPPGTGRAERSANQKLLAQFASEVGLALGLLKDCYRTSEAWPRGSRIAGISHAKHSKVAAKPNRVNLLLNEDMADGLSPTVRGKVEKTEALLGDAQVRTAVIDRSHVRNRRIRTAAKAVEDEELVKARVELKILEQNEKARSAAPEIVSKMAERAIKGNLSLAKMITELLDLKSVIEQIPAQYHERTIDNLSQIERAAKQAHDKLRPETRSPQPRDVIDLAVDHQPGAEHR